jgi:hypothetical protein
VVLSLWKWDPDIVTWYLPKRLEAAVARREEMIATACDQLSLLEGIHVFYCCAEIPFWNFQTNSSRSSIHVLFSSGHEN